MNEWWKAKPVFFFFISCTCLLRNFSNFSMDWNLKPREIEETRSNSFGFVRSNFSVDLKLGQVVSPFSPSGSKRTRSVVNNGGGQTSAYCLVDGCSADLGNCREYHRRHKVCEVHSKTPEVTISGHKRRFCQQCSRFHSLGEFDEGKRSCRKRLDGHNRRRRKPPPESSSFNHRPITLFSPGNKMFPFSTTTDSTAAMNHPTWPEGLRIDPFSVSSSSTRSFMEELGKQQFHSNNNNVFSSNLFNESQAKYFYDDGSSQILGTDFNRARSFLSSTSEIIGLNASNMQHYGVLNNNNNTRMESYGSVNYPTMFQDSSSTETPQTLPFYWRDG